MSATKIRKVRDNLLTLIAGALPDHLRLNDPYNLDENPEQLLRKGYGVRIDAATNTNRCIGQREYYTSRTFTVVITREALALDSDPKLREDKELELLDDLHEVVISALEDLTLGREAIECTWANDGGRQEIFVGDKPYCFIEAGFSVEYRQTLA